MDIVYFSIICVMKQESTTTKIRTETLNKLRLMSMLSKETQLDILDRLLIEEWEKIKVKYKDKIKEIFDV